MTQQQEQELLKRLLTSFPKMKYKDQLVTVMFVEATVSENPAKRPPKLRLITGDKTQ